MLQKMSLSKSLRNWYLLMLFVKYLSYVFFNDIMQSNKRLCLNCFHLVFSVAKALQVKKCRLIIQRNVEYTIVLCQARDLNNSTNVSELFFLI